MTQFAFFWFLCILSLDGSFQASPSPSVSISSNVTSVQVGQSVSLTCAVAAYQVHGAGFYLNFYREEDTFFCSYDIKDEQNADFSSDKNLFDTGYHALSWTFPLYQITLTPATVGTHAYRCNLYDGGLHLDVFSPNLTITVTPPPPSATLTSNVTSVTVGHPLTLTCTFANFNPLPGDYSVLFSSSRDGQLAVYEVTGGKALLSDALREDVQVSTGERSAYPIFDLIITEKINSTSSYSCALVAQGKLVPVRSNTWPVEVHFNSSKLTPTLRSASCDIGATGLDLNNQTEYSVQFLSDQGPKKVNLLAEYLFKRNHAEEFKYHPVTPWISIAHGTDTSFPTFSIVAHVADSLAGTWWCLLAVGEQGTQGYRELTSNKAHL